MTALHLIDAIGPFFRGLARRTINWSKIPFEYLREADEAAWSRIHADLHHFAQQVSGIGFNAVTLDDVWHLVDHEAYEREVRGSIRRYAHQFRRCFSMLREQGLQVFVTMDFFSSTPAMRAWLEQQRITPVEFTARVVDWFFCRFPEASGIIIRIGESDGRDVNDDFRSELLLKTARRANAFLKQLLPECERHGSIDSSRSAARSGCMRLPKTARWAWTSCFAKEGCLADETFTQHRWFMMAGGKTQRHG